MSTGLVAATCYALGLGLAALLTTRLLLTYVARREPEERGATLPTPAGLALVGVVTAASLLVLSNRPFAAIPAVEAGWAAALAVVFIIDVRVRYILDLWTVPLALLAIGAALLLPHPPYPTLLAVLGGGAIGLVLFGAFYGLGLLLFRQPALGLGDVKLAILIGLMLGANTVLTAIFAGVLIGGIGSLGLIVLRRATLSDAPAYGTYLSLGGYVGLLHVAGLWH